MIGASVLVIGAIAAFVLMGGKDDKKPAPEPAPTPASRPTSKPTEPAKPQPPKIGNDLFSKGRDLIKQMKPLYEQAAEYWDEAQAAKAEGDKETWQKYLQEAAGPLSHINDLWGEIEMMMPEDDNFGQDEVANHYFGKLYQGVGAIDKLRADVKKDQHAR